MPVDADSANQSRTLPQALADSGTKCIALRCAGFNNVDVDAAAELGVSVVRVPAYSPNAIAEHTIALILALNRNIHRAYNRVREHNFALHGLVGFDMKGMRLRCAPAKLPIPPPTSLRYSPTCWE